MTYPIIIKSSAKALLGKNFTEILIFMLLSISVAIYSTLNSSPTIIYFQIYVSCIWMLIFFIRNLFPYIRIKNTEYRIYKNKIQESSYLFKFLGVTNNTVNLSQLRQIKSYSNSYWDIWFFKCGLIKLTVSGDVADFELTNIKDPSQVRDTVGAIVFGKTNEKNIGFDSEEDGI